MKKITFNSQSYPHSFFNKVKSLNNFKFVSKGKYTKTVEANIENKFNFKKFLFVNSCTQSLELSALLSKIKPNDEIIMPSFTFSSTANAFLLRGAKINFVDSCENNPNINTNNIEKLINKKTKCIVVVHYAGVSCDMGNIIKLAKAYKLIIIEDAAQSLDAYYNSRHLGTIGHFGCISFHETKNLSSGEGGGLIINNLKDYRMACIIRDKGLNRIDFLKGKVSSYKWHAIGSSYAPSDILALLLSEQLKDINKITKKRLQLWKRYKDNLTFFEKKNLFMTPNIPSFANHNAHIFYIVCNSESQKNKLNFFMRQNHIECSGHYQSLHNSPFIKKNSSSLNKLLNAEKFSKCLLRMPIHNNLSFKDIDYISEILSNFYIKNFIY